MTLELNTTPVDETLYERRSRALSLRMAGGTFTQIATKLNVSAAQARKDVERARRDIIDSATRESLIADHRAIILDIRRSFYGPMTSRDTSNSERVEAAKLVLSTLQREAELFGLDAPKRMSLGVGTDVEFAETLAALIESVGYAPPADLMFAARGERIDSTSSENTIENTIDGEVVANFDECLKAQEADNRGNPSNQVVHSKHSEVVPAAQWSNVSPSRAPIRHSDETSTGEDEPEPPPPSL